MSCGSWATTAPESADSRYNGQSQPYHGFVPVDHVVGRAYAVVWPLSRTGRGWGTPSAFGEVRGGAGTR